MEDSEGHRIGARWFLRETLFVVVGAILWGAFGWRVLLGVIPVVLVVNLVWLARQRSGRNRPARLPRRDGMRLRRFVTGSDDVERELAFLRERIDPLADQTLLAVEPWDAYRVVLGIASAIGDDLERLPHGGAVYVAWAEVEDVYETGKTPVADAHALLRDAAARWLHWSSSPSATGLEQWLQETSERTSAIVRRDGDFWREPEGRR